MATVSFVLSICACHFDVLVHSVTRSLLGVHRLYPDSKDRPALPVEDDSQMVAIDFLVETRHTDQLLLDVNDKKESVLA